MTGSKLLSSLYSPCDLIFVHRDSETVPLVDRQAEITNAAGRVSEDGRIPPVVPVVPVRMTEAWLLSDERAIRNAAGNPNGSVALDLPRLRNVESIADPKVKLHELILSATELRARRKKRFDISSAVLRIPEYTADFSQLRNLAAFTALERGLSTLIEERGWRL